MRKTFWLKERVHESLLSSSERKIFDPPSTYYIWGLWDANVMKCERAGGVDGAVGVTAAALICSQNASRYMYSIKGTSGVFFAVLWRWVPFRGVPERFSLDNVSLGQCFPWTICPLDNVSLGPCVPWTVCPLVNVSLGQCVPWSMCP